MLGFWQARGVTGRSSELRDLAQRIVDELPPEVAEEVVLTGSVSRGVADELSDIEMLVVTPAIFLGVAESGVGWSA